MGDQKFVAIHDFAFFFILLHQRNLQFLEKDSSLIHFDYCPLNHGSLALSIKIYKSIHQNNEVSKNLERLHTGQEHSNFCV